jgi:hypothetical protein
MGSDYYSITNVTLDSSYASEGEALTAKDLGLRRITFAICNVTAGSESATLRPANAYYTPATEKLHLIDSATGKEMEATKDMSKVTVQVIAFGKP